mmetsp:Transcript_106607/g.301534  ORF Transcript_106607/g.301534 Transcript_106607/m.301534 type:complete len:228 (+) Transcript_106607:234-917(+)
MNCRQHIGPQQHHAPGREVDDVGLGLLYVVGGERQGARVRAYGDEAHDRPAEELEEPVGRLRLREALGEGPLQLLADMQGAVCPLAGLEAQDRDELLGGHRDVPHDLVQRLQALAPGPGLEVQLAELGGARGAQQPVDDELRHPPQLPLVAHVHALLQRLREDVAAKAGVYHAEALRGQVAHDRRADIQRSALGKDNILAPPAPLWRHGCFRRLLPSPIPGAPLPGA